MIYLKYIFTLNNYRIQLPRRNMNNSQSESLNLTSEIKKGGQITMLVGPLYITRLHNQTVLLLSLSLSALPKQSLPTNFFFYFS